MKHEWKRELGSEHAQRPEVGQLSGGFQSNQPIPNPSRERTVRPVVKDDTRTVQDGRKTSRSQEIDVDSFHEDTVSSERTGRPVVETSVIQTRSSKDSKDHHVEMAQERTRRLVIETNTENMPDDCQTRSCHDSETFNVGDKTLRERTERPVVDHDDSSHEQTMVNVVNMDFRIPGLPHSVVNTLFNKIYDKIKLTIRSVQNQMIQEVGNIELFELLETDPKTQCTACLLCWDVGIVYCTCGHFLQKETEANRNFVKYTMDLLSLPEYVIRKGRLHGHSYGKNQETKTIMWLTN